MTGENANEDAYADSHSELIILDAGPILNFMGRKETTDLYLETLKKMTDTIIVPDAVMDEVENKSRNDSRFSLCHRKLGDIIRGGHVFSRSSDVQGDDDYSFHWAWVKNNCPKSMLGSSKNRGEMVLVAHARVLQAGGGDIVAMIDDQDAIRLAEKAGIPSFTTVDLFHQSVAHGLITNKVDLKRIYGLVKSQDDGLQSFHLTTLKEEFKPSAF